ncbi:MAG TPA: aminoacyl-tRNA hydrolase [Candidatus Limnocylindria bacterium]|nr:aminoacyl-tRNA hydrolase [Candidatus Limnocylindria bacterium]
MRKLFGRPITPRAEKIIVGLGNPGDGYIGTRHNVGFAVAGRLAKRARTDFGTKAADSRIAEGSLGGVAVAIARPQTFMNDSGRAARKLLDRYRLTPADLIVISDDVDLPLGKIRIRISGGPGTHNGMRSLSGAIGDGFARIRVGVGPADAEAVVPDLAGYVLGPFTVGERELVDRTVDRAAEAAEVAVRDVQRAMNEFNG